ncbi:MAG: hypothetical protein AAGG50_08040 [Bacteroidota bacterium]
MTARFGLLSAIVLVAGAVPVTAQPLNAWVGAGVGYGALPELPEREQGEEGLGVLTGALFVSIERAPVVLTLRAAGATEYYGDEAYDVGVLVGVGGGGPMRHLSVGVGLALVNVVSDDDGLSLFGSVSGRIDGPADRTTTLGLPLEVQAFVQGRHVGLGLYGFVNLNREATFGGVTLAFVLGRWR